MNNLFHLNYSACYIDGSDPLNVLKSKDFFFKFYQINVLTNVFLSPGYFLEWLDICDILTVYSDTAHFLQISTFLIHLSRAIDYKYL